MSQVQIRLHKASQVCMEEGSSLPLSLPKESKSEDIKYKREEEEDPFLITRNKKKSETCIEWSPLSFTIFISKNTQEKKNWEICIEWSPLSFTITESTYIFFLLLKVTTSGILKIYQLH